MKIQLQPKQESFDWLLVLYCKNQSCTDMSCQESSTFITLTALSGYGVF
jgi:hypothetical protein